MLRKIWPSFGCVAAIFLLLCWAPVQAKAGENVIVNGDFSDGLAGWTCIEDSTQCGYYPEACSDCSVIDGNAVIHGYSAYGRPVLRQEFTEISPTSFTFWWDFNGDCGPLWVDLVSGEDVALRFRTKHDALISANTWTDINLAGVTERIEEPPNYLDNGICEVLFDYANLQAEFRIQSDRGYRSAVLPLPPDFSVNAIALTVENNCCDGRNDVYGYFDDVVLIAEPPITETTVDIEPDTLNLQSKGKWITCYIWLPEEYDVADVDPDSILLNGEISATWSWIDEAEQMLMVKFPRSEVQEMLEPGEVELTVSGELLDGTKFESNDTIRVIDKGGKK